MGNSRTIPSYVASIFDEKAELTYGGSPATLETFSAGVLLLPTGEIVACDPLGDSFRKPFVITVSPGRYPVTLYVSVPDNRIAMAMLRLNKTPTVSWEVALTPGNDDAQMISGYPVDSGTGCFMDARAARALNRKMKDNENYFERIISEMSGDRFSRFPFTNMMLTHKVPSNMIAFGTGVGDGLYASYFGRDEQGGVTCLVSDFQLLD
jgi:hypothetical protein